MAVVIGSGVVLTPDAVTNADNPLIGWHNIATVDNLTADEEADGYPVTNLANPITSLGAGWRGETTGEQYITLLTGSAEQIDYVALARHNFGDAGIAVSVEGRAGSGDSWSELVAPRIPAGSETITLLRFVPQALYQVRVKLAAGSVIPRASVLYAGTLVIVPRRIYVGHTPITMGREVTVANGRAESGAFLGRVVIGEGRSTTILFNNLKPDWYRTYFDPFVDAAAEIPFFFAWRPGSYPTEVGFVWLTSDPRPSNQRHNGMMQVTLEVNGIA